MFNLPNNTPYVIILEVDNGFLLMSSRFASVENGEMGPENHFGVAISRLDALAQVEAFLTEKASNETD